MTDRVMQQPRQTLDMNNMLHGSTPSISVIIPSYQRHEEVIRAVKSALSQTLPPCEIIVSNDGPDPEKGRLLAGLQDDRIKYVEAPRRKNASATRNFGVRHAKGEWIALLDDDDIWLPEKLELQFRKLQQAGEPAAILAGVERVYDQSGKTWCRPKGCFQSGCSVHDVLFSGAGGVNTSTIMAPAWAFRGYPFNEDAERHEDWEWLLESGQKLPLLVTPEVICERHLKPGEGLSRPGGYEYTKDWYVRNRCLMPADAQGRFISTILSRKAAYDRMYRALPWMFAEMRWTSSISFYNIGRLLMPWIIPSRARQGIRKLMSR